MSIVLKPGARVLSAVCTTELIVVRAPDVGVELTIGGAPPLLDAAAADRSAGPLAGHGGGCDLGKRYVDAAQTLELLCTKRGDGVPALDGEVLELKQAKPLPSSD